MTGSAKKLSTAPRNPARSVVPEMVHWPKSPEFGDWDLNLSSVTYRLAVLRQASC